MERLTARNSIGQVYFPHCFREDTCDGDGASDKCNTCDFNQKIADTLAKFEDLQDMIGIPYEKLAELCKEEIPDECKNPSKTIILTDDSVDEWHQYKTDKEQGLLLRLPCKVGSTLYQPISNRINEYKVIGLCFDITRNEWMYEVAYQIGLEWHKTTCDFDCINKTVFLTKEEAEQALAKMKGE